MSEESLLIKLKEIIKSKGIKLEIINAVRDIIDDYDCNDVLPDELEELWFIVHRDDSIEGTYKKIKRFLDYFNHRKKNHFFRINSTQN